MNNIIRKSLAALAVVSFSLSANAALITGSLSIAGSVTFIGGNANTATGFSSLGPAFVTSASGNFATSSNIVTFPNMGATSLTMTAFNYGTSAVPALSGNSNPTWTTPALGGITTSFNLTSITLVDHNIVDQVTMLGIGVFKMTGFDDTIGSFNLTANQAGTTFSFSASQTAFAPDGGSTAILLGLGLGFLGFAARRFKAL